MGCNKHQNKEKKQRILPGVILGASKMDFFAGGGLLEVGDTHMGVHLGLLLGRPGECTGSNSQERFNVAQAILKVKFKYTLFYS